MERTTTDGSLEKIPPRLVHCKMIEVVHSILIPMSLSRIFPGVAPRVAPSLDSPVRSHNGYHEVRLPVTPVELA